MLDELNDLLEGNIIDIVCEGIGTVMGIALLWGLFWGGMFDFVCKLMAVLSSSV